LSFLSSGMTTFVVTSLKRIDVAVSLMSKEVAGV